MPLANIVLDLVVIFLMKSATALIGHSCNNGFVLTPLYNANIKIWTRHIYHLLCRK